MEKRILNKKWCNNHVSFILIYASINCINKRCDVNAMRVTVCIDSMHYQVSIIFEVLLISLHENKKIFRSNPKAYMAIDWESNKFKRSSKGVQHRVEMSYEDFKAVVYTSKILNIKNISIRSHRRQMSTIETNKVGLKNLFVKARVDQDCVTISPFERFIKET